MPAEDLYTPFFIPKTAGWSTTNSPSAVTAGGWERCIQDVGKALQPAFLRDLHCKGMALDSSCSLTAVTLWRCCLQASSQKLTLPLPSCLAPLTHPLASFSEGKNSRKLIYIFFKNTYLSLPVEHRMGPDRCWCKGNLEGKGREAGLSLQ